MPIVSREVAESIIEEIYINKEKRGNSNTMILNGDEVMKNTVHLKIKSTTSNINIINNYF